MLIHSENQRKASDQAKKYHICPLSMARQHGPEKCRGQSCMAFKELSQHLPGLLSGTWCCGLAYPTRTYPETA